MKTNIYKIVIIILLLAAGSSCNDNSEQPTSVFYYYSSEKIYLQQINDKILLKFTSDANNEQISGIIGSNPSLQPMYNINVNETNPISIIILETKNGKPISSATIESFKANTEVVSVTYLYQYNGQRLQGLTDEFVVKLKDATSYKQLQELADKNNCKIGSENQFVKNQFMISVSKTSKLDALQTSNLFYETGLFEFAEPNFIIFNPFS